MRVLRIKIDEEKVVELTEWELAVAIMADSVGYASPDHALRHVKDYLNGEKHAYCERGLAVFKADLEALIRSAAYYWHGISPERREKLKKFAEAWKKLSEKDPAANWTISSLYPTLNI